MGSFLPLLDFAEKLKENLKKGTHVSLWCLMKNKKTAHLVLVTESKSGAPTVEKQNIFLLPVIQLH